MKLDFNLSKFDTEYSFSSSRSIVRPLSDAFSRQFCSSKNDSIKYAVVQTEGKCLYCGDKMYEVDVKGVPRFRNNIHYDHIYPASRLNLFEIGNVAISCVDCNLEKSDRLPLEYYKLKEDLGQKVSFNSIEEFEQFLYEFSTPYREKWPKHYEAGTRNIEDDDEFKQLITDLLYSQVHISSISNRTRYNYEFSVNKPIWDKVVKKAYETYQALTAKDVEGRIGYTNETFEIKFGSDVEIKEISLSNLNEFIHELLNSKSESKNEVQKYRMLVKMLVEVLNETYMQGQLDNFYKDVPTFKKLNQTEKAEDLEES